MKLEAFAYNGAEIRKSKNKPNCFNQQRKDIYETGFYLSWSARPPQPNDYPGASTSGAQSRGCLPLFVRRCRATVCSWSREGSHQRKATRDEQKGGTGLPCNFLFAQC